MQNLNIKMFEICFKYEKYIIIVNNFLNLRQSITKGEGQGWGVERAPEERLRSVRGARAREQEEREFQTGPMITMELKTGLDPMTRNHD